ncbi:chromosome segregation DNA-binding protein [Faunimonas pinastri]|uniref:Chromosome segregation DNA-binding protein n=1 Tax=Faunimonas pinastri TaxID=1855383 RepID=A0A1H9GVL2_9HYPH|nr:ParB/RepB/Spo0J family partition protein [Faunimonas pinastri]SEQ54117.1 chromosome segregation DNA-binding protein [Faunimonas pinastri]
MALETRKRLGRGLDALLGDYPIAAVEAAPLPDASRRTVPVGSIHPNPRNPRREFLERDLEDLAASIRAHGIVQPIVVRPMAGPREGYEIIAGERRWRASQLASLHEVPVHIIEVSDREALELAIVENVQRSDLNPVEEAMGYQALMSEFGYTQADLGATIGKSRVHVTNTLRLLKLPRAVLSRLESGELSAGHGRALITAPDPEKLARVVVDKGLSVRETEKLAQTAPETLPAVRSRAPAEKDADTRAVEQELSEHLGLSVDLRHRAAGKGEIRISYSNLEQLEALCRKLRA